MIFYSLTKIKQKVTVVYSYSHLAGKCMSVYKYSLVTLY